MPRFEFVEGKSSKFWEIELQEESFTTRWGKIGTDGQETTKDFDSKAEARKEYDKLIQEKTKKGYVLVDGGGGPSIGKRNPDLEKAILENIDDVSRFLVYGDWLQENGDERGELVAIQARLLNGPDAALSKREKEIITALRERDFGAAAEMTEGDEAPVSVGYRLGFPSELRVAFTYDSWEEYGSDQPIQDILAAFFKNPASVFLRSLTIGMPDFDGECDFAPSISALAKVGKHEALRRLYIGDFEYPDDTEISWAQLGDVGKLWAVFPNLEHLELQGASIGLGKISAPKLKHLELRTGGLPKGAIKSIAGAELPSLEKLSVWTGSHSYGADSKIADWKPILDGKNLPKLTHLGVRNSEYSDDVAEALPKAGVLKQLREIDLSMGLLTEKGAQALAKHREAFAHLTNLNVSENALRPDAVALFSGWPNVSADGQEPDRGEGDYRYVQIGE